MKNLRLITLLIFILSVGYTSAQSIRKLMEMPDHIIEGKWELNRQEATELNYYNNDYCNYYLFQEHDRSYVLRPGKNTIFKKEKNSHAENPLKNAGRYMFFRGQFPEEFQIDTPYALPIKNGKEITWCIDSREQLKTMNFLINEGDTIYATRRGIACQTKHPRQLLICHHDCTFAAYLMMRENFIHPGEEILTGQPVGVAGLLGVSISYFFLDSNKFKVNLPMGHPYSHFTPVFRTDKGDVKMEEKMSYKAVIDDGLMMLDMSKREQKKYLKQKHSK